jgi:hypothetical protein
MTIHDALVILLEATVEKDDDREVRKARKRIAQKVESLRLKQERAAQRELTVTAYKMPEPINPNN